MTTDFNLRDRVRQVLAKSDDADPTSVADSVRAGLSKAEAVAALDYTLRMFVRQIISETRLTSSPHTLVPIRPSAKVAGIRDYHARLRDRYHVGHGQWKFLADMTAEDLRAAAAERRAIAASTAVQADRLDEWARLVRSAGVATFGALPDVDEVLAA